MYWGLQTTHASLCTSCSLADSKYVSMGLMNSVWNLNLLVWNIKFVKFNKVWLRTWKAIWISQSSPQQPFTVWCRERQIKIQYTAELKTVASKKKKKSNRDRKSNDCGLVLCATRCYLDHFPTNHPIRPVVFNWTFTVQGWWWSLENTKRTLFSQVKKKKDQQEPACWSRLPSISWMTYWWRTVPMMLEGK